MSCTDRIPDRVARQITEAFPWNEVPGYLIRDRDGIYGVAVTRRLRAMGIRDKPIQLDAQPTKGMRQSRTTSAAPGCSGGSRT